MVRQRQADLLLVAATVIAACGWIFSREAIAGMPVFAFPGLRFFFAALLLLPWVAVAGVASTFPAASLARTLNVCEPSARPL